MFIRDHSFNRITPVYADYAVQQFPLQYVFSRLSKFFIKIEIDVSSDHNISVLNLHLKEELVMYVVVHYFIYLFLPLSGVGVLYVKRRLKSYCMYSLLNFQKSKCSTRKCESSLTYPKEDFRLYLFPYKLLCILIFTYDLSLKN